MDNAVTSLPEGEIRLRDGRRLAYAEYGDPQGKPILFFHGTPGSRLFHHPDNSVAASAGARVIAIDRPGFGRSDFKPGRTLLDWPSDIVQLADALNIDRFAVMGYSGGGPYAAVCASAIPDRLTAAGLVSSISPLDTPQITKGMHGMGHTFFTLERHLPPLARLSCKLLCTTWRSNPDLYFKAQINGLYSSREAQAMLPVMKDMLTADLLEAVRDGTGGITWDLEILAKPWGFQLHTIPTNVFLWHGENDTQAPVAMGKRLAAAIPHCRPTFFPGEGHWAIYNHWQEILTALARAEATIYEQPQTATVPAAQDINSRSETAILTSSLDSEDSPTDSVQGLQPAREMPVVETAEATQVITATADEPAARVSSKAGAAQEAPKAVARKAGKRRAAPNADTPAAVSHEPEPVHATPKSAAKKTAKARAGAVADATAAVSAEPEPAPEASKPAPKKAAAHRTAAADDSPGKGSSSRKSAPQKAKTPAGKTPKSAAVATASKPKPSTGSAKTSVKKPGRPEAAIADPPSADVPEESSLAAESPEPISARSSSRRRSAKEAVLV